MKAMRDCRGRFLVVLAVACCGCWRSGDVFVLDDGGTGTEAATMADAARDSSAHKDGGGPARDGGKGHHADAHDSGAAEPDARADAERPRDATMDSRNDAKPDASRDSATDAGRDVTTDTGSDAVGACVVADDCPAGEACNPINGSCTKTCSAAILCNGCCAEGECVANETECVTLQAGDGAPSTTKCQSSTAFCAPCTGSYVCGDGVSYGTELNYSYICKSPMPVSGTPCAFGCDPQNGLCKDLVPANGANQTSLPTGPFSCLKAPQSGVDAITTQSGDTLSIELPEDTTQPGAITLTSADGGSPQIVTASWGTPPTLGNGTPFVVVHVSSLTLAGTTVYVSGSYALVFLVDGNVSISGSTVINLQANGSAGGPGASPNNGYPAGQGGLAPSTSTGGGGGAGHGVPGGVGGPGGPAGGSMPDSGVSPGLGGQYYGLPFVLAAGSTGGGYGGGGGGGALQISACGDISIGHSVLLNASGGGGAGGSTSSVAASGGGSGGTIILEGASFSSLDGWLVANGGGGGAGWSRH